MENHTDATLLSRLARVTDALCDNPTLHGRLQVSAICMKPNPSRGRKALEFLTGHGDMRNQIAVVADGLLEKFPAADVHTEVCLYSSCRQSYEWYQKCFSSDGAWRKCRTVEDVEKFPVSKRRLADLLVIDTLDNSPASVSLQRIVQSVSRVDAVILMLRDDFAKRVSNLSRIGDGVYVHQEQRTACAC